MERGAKTEGGKNKEDPSLFSVLTSSLCAVSTRSERPKHANSVSSTESKTVFTSLSSNTQQALKVIKEHNSSRPLFLYLPFQNVHFPVQAPQKYVDKYSFIDNKTRRTYAAMLDIVDEAIGNVTRSLEKAG